MSPPSFSPSSIQEITNSFFRSLQVNNSPLSDFSEGSVIYTIARAQAAIYQQLESNLINSHAAFYLSTAEGTDLDTRASDFYIQRLDGSPASGSALFTPMLENYLLSPNTLLIEPKSLLQYITLNTNSISLQADIDTRVPISSLDTGSICNLAAGTRIYVEAATNLRVIVGTHRHPTGEYCTPLSGGRDIESDLLLRMRAINSLRSRRGTTQLAIQTDLLTLSDVEWVSVSSSLPGLITVWVDSSIQLSAQFLKTVAERVDEIKAAGLVSQVLQPSRQFVSISIKVQDSYYLDQTSYSYTLRSLVQSYMYNLGVSSTFNPQQLQSYLSSQLSSTAISVEKPDTSISIAQNSVLRLSDLDITYDVL